jgi:hypothetical protein
MVVLELQLHVRPETQTTRQTIGNHQRPIRDDTVRWHLQTLLN